MLIVRCVDVFAKVYVSFRFVSKQKKASDAAGCLLSFFDISFTRKGDQFGARYVLIHFETLRGI